MAPPVNMIKRLADLLVTHAPAVRRGLPPPNREEMQAALRALQHHCPADHKVVISYKDENGKNSHFRTAVMCCVSAPQLVYKLQVVIKYFPNGRLFMIEPRVTDCKQQGSGTPLSPTGTHHLKSYVLLRRRYERMIAYVHPFYTPNSELEFAPAALMAIPKLLRQLAGIFTVSKKCRFTKQWTDDNLLIVKPVYRDLAYTVTWADWIVAERNNVLQRRFYGITNVLEVSGFGCFLHKTGPAAYEVPRCILSVLLYSQTEGGAEMSQALPESSQSHFKSAIGETDRGQ
ncbi:hypothetical protein BDZ91DRAFT_841623 [Kalaharituber pfeilii]|nr:hypothetical protein BDZ91DRAFT_841623 [Kalaharituber pfeilii]